MEAYCGCVCSGEEVTLWNNLSELQLLIVMLWVPELEKDLKDI